MQGKRIVSLGASGTDPPGGTVARHGRGLTRECGRASPLLVLAAVAVLVAWAFFAGGASGTDATAPLGTAAVARRGGSRRRLVARSHRAAAPRPRRHRGGRRGDRARRLDGPEHLVVDRRRPLLGRAREGHRPARLRRRRPRRRRPSRAGRCGRSRSLLAVALGAVLVWALLGKAIPALGPDDAGRVARLKGSIGYWNALALLADAALGLGLWLARLGAASASAGPPAPCSSTRPRSSILLTQSRAGLIAAARRRRPRALAVRAPRRGGAARRCSPLVPAIVVAGWAFTRPALVEDGGARADRVSDGAAARRARSWSARLAVARARRPRPGRAARRDPPAGRRARPRRRALRSSPSSARSASSRASGIRSPGRPTRSAARARWRTTRAGSAASRRTTAPSGGARRGRCSAPIRPAARARGPSRSRASAIRDDAAERDRAAQRAAAAALRHGPAGASLLGLALVVGLVARAPRDARGGSSPDERAAAVGLVALPLAFGLHALVDYDLDFLAVAAPTALVSAALLGAGRPAARSSRRRADRRGWRGRRRARRDLGARRARALDPGRRPGLPAGRRRRSRAAAARRRGGPRA